MDGLEREAASSEPTRARRPFGPALNVWVVSFVDQLLLSTVAPNEGGAWVMFGK